MRQIEEDERASMMTDLPASVSGNQACSETFLLTSGPWIAEAWGAAEERLVRGSVTGVAVLHSVAELSC